MVGSWFVELLGKIISFGLWLVDLDENSQQLLQCHACLSDPILHTMMVMHS